jgi:hypothetical protein
MSRYELPVTVFSAKKNCPMILLHMTSHQTFTFGLSRTCSMMLCGCCDPHIATLCLFTVSETSKVALSENMMFVRKLGPLPIRSSMSQTKCVVVGCPLVSAPAESAPCTHRDTTAFGEPCAQLLEASAVPVKPDKLTCLDFG